MTRLTDRDDKWRSHIAALVAAAPPLTPAQIAKLSSLFDSSTTTR